jgi:hypothetical protein
MGWFAKMKEVYPQNNKQKATRFISVKNYKSHFEYINYSILAHFCELKLQLKYVIKQINSYFIDYLIYNNVFAVFLRSIF